MCFLKIFCLRIEIAYVVPKWGNSSFNYDPVSRYLPSLNQLNLMKFDKL